MTLKTAAAFTLLTLTAFTPLTTHAADNSAEIKSLISAFLTAKAEEAKAKGSALTQEGALNVESKGNYYTATLPHLTYTQASGETLNIGKPILNIQPSGDDYKVSFALPRPMGLIGSNGKEKMSLDVGTQQTAGVYDTELKAFTKLDATYKNATIKETSQGLTISIPNSKILYDLDKGSDNLLSGPVQILFDNITATSAKENTTSTIGSVALKSLVKNQSLENVRRFSEQLSALAQNAPRNANASPQHNQALTRALFDFLTKTSDSFASTFTVSDIKAKSAATQLGLEQFRMAIDSDGLRSNNSSGNITLSYSGLSNSSGFGLYDSLVPRNVSFSSTVKNMPLSEVVEPVLNIVGAGDQYQARMQELLPPLFDKFKAAGTELEFKTAAGAPEFTLNADGHAAGSANAVKGYTQLINAKIRGLDKVSAMMAEGAKNTQDPRAQITLTQAMATLAILNAAGQPDKADPQSRNYKLEVLEDGRTLVNGADMTALMALGRQ